MHEGLVEVDMSEEVAARELAEGRNYDEVLDRMPDKEQGV